MTTLEAIVPAAGAEPVLAGFEGGETTVFSNGKPLFKYDGPARSRQDWAAIHALAHSVRLHPRRRPCKAPTSPSVFCCVRAVHVDVGQQRNQLLGG